MDDERRLRPPIAGVDDNQTRAGMRAAAAAVTVCTVGALALAYALTRQQIDSCVLAATLFAVGAGPLSASLQAGGREPLRLPLIHPVLLGCALSLGPAAALPAVAVGISGLLSAGSERRPLYRVLYTLFRPAALALATSTAFAAAGGSSTRPCEVASAIPACLAAAVYAALWLMLRRIVGPSPSEKPRLSQEAAAWTVSAAGGYCLAAFVAVAPSYAVGVGAAGALASIAAVSAGQLRRKTAATSPSPRSVDAASTYVDSATGLANRRYMEMFLEREVGRSHRLGKAVSVAVFNLDDSVGLSSTQLDDASAEVGRVLAAEVRGYDVVCRYSEGRIVVVLPETTPDLALEVAERLRSLARKACRVSCGLATCPTHADTAQELINAAHHALNRGKFEDADKVHVCRALAKAG